MANAPTQHARHSPSGASKWMNCAGAITMESVCPASSSKYADEGSAAHELAALTLQDKGHNCEAYLGRMLPSEGVKRKFEVTEEMCRYVQTYVDSVLEFAEGNILLVEQPLPIGQITGELGAEGTGDAVIITSDGEIQVHDLKYGKGVEVSAENNKQLQMYALGACYKYAAAGPFKRVRVVIHQPRIVGRPSEWDIDPEELFEFFNKAKAAADYSHSVWSEYRKNPRDIPASMLNPTKDGCQWCRAQAICPALGRKVKVEIMGKFEHLLDKPLTAQSVIESGTKLMDADAETLAQAMAAGPMIENWIKSVYSMVEALLLQGRPVPGYKLVEGRQGNREWSDKQEAESTLKAMRYKTEDMYNLKLISPTDAEKLLKHSNPRRWSKLQGLIFREAGKPSVAPESDKRPALTPSSAFTNLIEQ